MRNAVLIFLLLIFSELWSITPYKTYSVADGLTNNTIKAVCQDSLGYIWLGTRNGLIRFDGYEFRNYNYDIQRENIVYSNDITCLTKDKKGQIWIGTFNWITLFDPFSEQFVELNLKYPEGKLPKGVVTNIWIDKKDRVWVSSKTGLYLLYANEVKAINSLKGAYINCMASYDDDNLLVEVMGKGIAMYNISTDRLKYLDESKVENRPMIYKIFKDSKNRIWLGADSNHIFLLQNQSKSVVKVNISLPEKIESENDQIHDIIEYNDSILIFGTDNGLLAINPTTHVYINNITNILQSDLLLHNRIMSLYKDNQGALWVGTFNKGVKYYNPNRYYFSYHDFKLEDGSPASIVGNIVEHDNKLWVGHEHGISMMDMHTGNFSHFNLLKQGGLNPSKKSELFYIYKKTPDQLYFYLLNQGISIMDMRNMNIVSHINIPPTSQVRSMAEDKLGNIWIAEEELSIYNPKTKEVNNSLPTNINNITSFMLAQDLLLRHNGNMLVGTRTSGVWEYVYEEQETKKYARAEQLALEELKDKNVNVLFEDSKNNIWIGTYGSGLYLYDLENGKYKCFNQDRGLVHNSICGILEDETNGDIWVATLTGLSKINRNRDKIINYTSKNGFPLDEISKKAFLKGSDGLFYVGGKNGIVSFDPSSFRDKAYETSMVRITSVESLNKADNNKRQGFRNTIDLKNVEFPFNSSSIVIKFSALNYFFPQGSKYAYKMSDVEQDWILTERNEVTYSNLSEGEYIFYVKAIDSDGTWSAKSTQIKIIIHPPIWRTIWAKILYLILATGLLYFIVQYIYNKKTLKYKQQINRIEKENIEKYYQMKLELFTKFSHELRTPLTLITGPTEDILNNENLPGNLQYSVKLIHKNANRLLLLVNQLMDFRKIEHGSMELKVRQIDIESFLSEQIENFLEVAKKKGISLAYLNLYWEQEVWFDTELMEKVIFNLISNAIRHTDKGGEIVITSKRQDGFLILSVKDNGEGISPQNIDKIFDPFFQDNRGIRNVFSSGIGLNLAKYVVNLHKGKIWAQSELGKGAEFFIRLPLGLEHFEENHTEILTSTDKIDYNYFIEKKSLSPIDVDDSVIKENNENSIWVLIVEDDDDLRHYIVGQLSSEYAILEATNGKDALPLAFEKLPDLIITDIQMPVMDGIELCKQVKNDIRTAHIPVIMLTARDMNKQIEEGYEALADDYILKPFDSNLLKVRVRSVINNREQLKKIFSHQLASPDIPVIDVIAKDGFMEKLFEIVRTRIEDPELSINYLSSELGISRAQFFRKIKAISDLSPNKIILNMRMKMAADLLKSKQFTISEVAYKVGFSDPAYFSKTFKTVFNITPTDFIKNEN